ncbi:hypothetical protein Tco_1505811 [Tanacetum coccineum]
MEIKIDEWEKSQNLSLEQTNRTDPPPPQAHTEHVNVVFTGSGKSDDHLKIQKDPPPPIIVDNKTKKDKPIKTSKRGYHVVKTNEYPYQSIQIESHKSFTEHPIVNEFIIINIPEEDVKPEPNLPLQEIIIIDPGDQPMWENAKIVAPTPNSTIAQINGDDNFVINSTHLNMIRKNKFDGYLRADPHDHIRKFLAICNKFIYGETQSEAVKLLIFPFSLSDKAKTWFNELNEESITSWDQMRKSNRRLVTTQEHASKMSWARSYQRSYHSIILSRSKQEILEITAGGNFLYKSPNQAFHFLEDKVLFKLDWSLESKIEHHRKSVAFADGSDSNTDSSQFMEKMKAMDSQIISLNEELQDIRNKYNELRNENASKNNLNNDTLMCKRHEANYIQSEELNNDVRNYLEDFKRCICSIRTDYDKLYDRDDDKTIGVLPNKESKTVNQEPQSKKNLEKSITKFLDDQRVKNMFVKIKNNVNNMIIKMKQNKKNFQTKIKNMERKIYEWSKSQNISSEQTGRIDLLPPPAQTKHVNNDSPGVESLMIL